MFELSVALSPAATGFAPLLFAGQIEQGIRVAAELGYDAVELSLRDLARQDLGPILERIRAAGLQVSAIATGQVYLTDGLSLANPDGDRRAGAVARVRGFIEAAAPLQAFVILGGIRGRLEGPPERLPEQRAQAVEAIAACVRHAEAHGVTLLLEPINRYETNFINTIDDGLLVLKEIGSPSLGLLADTFHMNIEEASILESLRLAGRSLRYVHFVDSNRCAPGAGHLDFKEIVATLRRMGYRGFLAAEIIPRPDDFHAAQMALLHVGEILASKGGKPPRR
ncbi:MAG TPA: sugar phosphate isomerase/epimerase family protein [Candidatus Sulfotelmatobacter sp.]|nr:sugar phosphate isomerase/epimerase family protein [Candidatus Sulfotelmatobacter sp.]